MENKEFKAFDWGNDNWDWFGRKARQRLEDKIAFVSSIVILSGVGVLAYFMSQVASRY